jgi:hypothetical protein
MIRQFQVWTEIRVRTPPKKEHKKSAFFAFASHSLKKNKREQLKTVPDAERLFCLRHPRLKKRVKRREQF